MVAAGIVILTFGLLGVGAKKWWQAIELARRPQKIKYDHSWLTNLLGETSTPHERDDSKRRDPKT